MQCGKHFTSFKYEKEVKYQERSQNMKQFPENFMKDFNVDDAPQASQLMTLYKKINIASKKLINYRVTSASNNCC